jgi:hypothetical protein
MYYLLDFFLIFHRFNHYVTILPVTLFFLFVLPISCMHMRARALSLSLSPLAAVSPVTPLFIPEHHVYIPLLLGTGAIKATMTGTG